MKIGENSKVNHKALPFVLANKWENSFMEITKIIGSNSTCVSHKVGAVLTKDNRIISTGYNGVVSGAPHCEEVFDKEKMSGVEYKRMHSKWSDENELHAEINCLMYAARSLVSTEDTTMYVSLSPCTNCTKSILAAGVKRLIFSGDLRTEKEDCGLHLLKSLIPIYKTIDVRYYYGKGLWNLETVLHYNEKFGDIEPILKKDLEKISLK